MAKKYNKTVVQIILRWHIQEGIIVFPRSTQKEHLAENINIFDFELSCSEIKEIRKLNKKQPYFTMTYEEQEKKLFVMEIRRLKHRLSCFYAKVIYFRELELLKQKIKSSLDGLDFFYISLKKRRM